MRLLLCLCLLVVSSFQTYASDFKDLWFAGKSSEILLRYQAGNLGTHERDTLYIGFGLLDQGYIDVGLQFVYAASDLTEESQQANALMKLLNENFSEGGKIAVVSTSGELESFAEALAVNPDLQNATAFGGVILGALYAGKLDLVGEYISLADSLKIDGAIVDYAASRFGMQTNQGELLITRAKQAVEKDPTQPAYKEWLSYISLVVDTGFDATELAKQALDAPGYQGTSARFVGASMAKHYAPMFLADSVETYAATLDTTSEAYFECLLTLAELYTQTNNVELATAKAHELLRLNPHDVFALSMLVYCYNMQEKYDKGDELLAELQAQFKEYKLPWRLLSGIPVDQFVIGDHIVMSMFYFNTPGTRMYMPHKFIFYSSETGQYQFSMQLEKTFTLPDSKIEYILGRYDGAYDHSNYGIGLPKDYTYQELKEMVANVIEEDAAPSARTILKKD